jgi:hypothetical protein
MKMEQSVPKRRHIKFRRRGTTQKKTYNILNTTKVWNQELAVHVLGDVFAHYQEHLIVFTVSGNVHPSCCRLVSWMSWNCYSKSALHVSVNVFAHHQEHLTIFTVSGSVHVSNSTGTACAIAVTPVRQLPSHVLDIADVNTTRYCKYSQVLLMMGENIAQNM